jgi:hypothetical protein
MPCSDRVATSMHAESQAFLPPQKLVDCPLRRFSSAALVVAARPMLDEHVEQGIALTSF